MTKTAPAQSLPLTGQHAFVTGGGRGIGAAVASELGRLGADLTLAARDVGALETHQRALDETIPGAVAVQQLDLADPDSAAAAFAGAVAARGAPQILINNAGMAPAQAIDAIDEATWNRTFAVNVTGPMQLMRLAVPAMREAGYGRIVNVASTAALKGYPQVSGYVASKHALLGLTRAVALELARTGITVNAVCPGYTDTDIAAGAIDNLMKAGKSEAEARKLLSRGNPQGRLVRPDEVAQTVGWLCLPGTTAVTGQAIAVAGGEVM